MAFCILVCLLLFHAVAGASQQDNEGRGIGPGSQKDAGHPSGNNSIASRNAEKASQGAAQRPIISDEGLSTLSWLIAVLGLLMLAAAATHRHIRRTAIVERADVRTPVEETVVPAAEDRGLSSTQIEQPGFPHSLLEKYDRIAYIGMGGTARVFRAERKSDRAVVAVKVPLRLDEVTGRCFLREMTIWERLDHPNIVRLFSVNILPVPYVEMEYICRSLDDTAKPMGTAMAAEIVRGIAAGLEYAHGLGVIHRDIKPRNILLADGMVPKITDWGLGRMLADPRDTVNAGFSPAYAAPEQIAPEKYGRTDARTDIYQLGAIFYELIAGRPPLLRDTVDDSINAILHEMPAPLSSLSQSIEPYDTIIQRCLEKIPGDRYESMAEFIAVLDRAKEVESDH